MGCASMTLKIRPTPKYHHLKDDYKLLQFTSSVQSRAMQNVWRMLQGHLLNIGVATFVRFVRFIFCIFV